MQHLGSTSSCKPSTKYWLSLCLSIFPSVHLTAVCIQCHTAAAAAAAVVWYKRVGGTASCFPSKKWTDILLEQLLKGWIWLPVSCIAQSFPSARTDKEDKRKEYWKGRRTGSGGDIYIYMYVSIKEKTRKSHGEVKGVWKKTDYKKKKDGRGLSTRTWREEGAGAGNWR